MSAPATRAAARERAWRSLRTGIGLDVLVAVAVAILAWLPAADVSSSAAWALLGTVLLKSILQAGATYVVRLKVPPTTEVDGAFDPVPFTARHYPPRPPVGPGPGEGTPIPPPGFDQ